MWTKPVSEMNWHDISTICPICDRRMSGDIGYYASSKCPNGHYEVSSGNYHVDFIVNGKWVATTDDMFNEQAYATLEKVIPEARKKWRNE